MHPQPAAGVDTSRDGKTSGTQSEGRGQTFALPKEFGRYRIVRKLGEGGMGIVYLAHDTELDRQVALKMPKLNEGMDNPLIERFYREARAAANLRHANICPVHDVGEVDGTRYICMAYIEGRPLSAYVRRDGTQPERQVALVVRKLAIALQEAHSHGVVHRDLKPANIMIDQNKEPVIMDFGLAQSAGQAPGFSTDGARFGRGFPSLHVSRAGGWRRRSHRSRDRYLQPRSNSLRTLDGPRSV